MTYPYLYVRLPKLIRSLIPVPSLEALREVDEVIDVEMYVPGGGHDYWCDAFIESAGWRRQERDLTEGEIDKLMDDQDFVWDEIERTIY